MIMMLLRFLGPAVAGVLVGWWLGMSMERADWTDFTKNLAEEAAEAARAADAENEARLAALRAQHELDVAEYQRVLAETAASERNARRIARELRERVDGLRTEFAALQARFTGGSVCRFDPVDVRVLNDAIGAANRGREPGVPGGADPAGP